MRLQTQQGLNQKDTQIFKHYKQKHFGGHKKCPTAIAWNTQGTALVTAENNIKLWSLGNDASLQRGVEIKGHQTNIETAHFANSYLLATMSRQFIRLWDIREISQQALSRIQKKTKSDFVNFAVSNTQMSGTGHRFAVIARDNSVSIYNHRNLAQPESTISSKANSSSSFELHAARWDRTDSVLFLVGGESNEGSIALYGGSSFEQLDEPISSHAGRITDIDFSRDNQFFMTASQDSMLELHSIPEIICEKVYSHKMDSPYRKVSFCSNGHYVAASCQSNTIDIVNIKEGGFSHRIKCSLAQDVLAWHPKKPILAYIDQQEKRRVLDRNEQNYIHLFYQ